MISLPDITIITQIYESANSLVYRGIRKSNQQPLILKLLKEDYPTPAELYRYQQEYEITHHLDLAGVIKAYELRKYQNTLLILLEDFGGESLKILQENRDFDLLEVLDLAIKITDILSQIHQKNIIHKDINPSNIIFNPQTKQLKIIDFGISSLLSQENPTIKSPNIIEGTLAYISPEQTGRMNRTIDYRTDFYSLGITFYELLTNQLPFPESDTLELIHCHLAKQPTPPHQINPEIPLPVSEIVMKLIAKTAEERYQSAYGLKADLETCLTQYKNRKINGFILGSKDIPHQLQIPEKLYGRQLQIQSLLNAFLRFTSGIQQPELMLISGYSGIGKSALVRELYKLITEKRGYFISGKFDQLHRDIPYQGLIAAFQELIRQLLTETESQLQQWREKILAAVGVTGQIIIDIIPEVELIIGPQPTVPELQPIEAQNRFNLVFQRFIQVFCQPEHPLVLFLDDLQWTDSATLKQIQLFITQANTQYLFLIGAYRDNEVSATHPLMLTLSEMKKQGVVVNHISLSPLSLIEVNQLIADTLKQENIQTKNLAELVWQKTQGNPFFIKEFLKSLDTEGLLIFDITSGKWTWNSEKIRLRNLTDDVVELMSGKIQTLSRSAQKVLQLAACIGNQFDFKTLFIINEKSPQETADELKDAELAGLVLPIGDDYKFLKTNRDVNELKISYKFAHDRIQQAAYSLIPDSHRKVIHLSIGRLLLNNISPSQREEKIFEIVEQLNWGIELLETQVQRDELAQLNLIAGKKAKVSAAYQTAFNYLSNGLQLLPVSRWKTHYDMTLALSIEAAEAAYLCGNFAEMERLISLVLQQAKTLLDKVKVYEVKIAALVAEGKLVEAIYLGIAVLKMLGINLPKNPNQFDIVSSLIQTKLALFGKDIEKLIHLRQMSEADKIAAVSLLVKLSAVAYIALPNLFPIIVFKSVSLLVKYGHTQLGEVVYAGYGLILCAALGDIESGYRFGNLALNYLNLSNSQKAKTKIIFSVNGFTKIWREPIKDSLPSLLEGYTSGLETGDFETGAYCAMLYAYYYVLTCQDLTQAEGEIANYIEAVKKLEQTRTAENIGIHRQVVLNLLGQSESPSQLIGESYNESAKIPLALAAKDNTTLFDTYSYKLTLSYLFGDYEQAIENAKLTEKYLDGGLGTPAIPIFYFYDSLTRLALYPSLGKLQRKLWLYRVTRNQKKLKKWADYAPMNYLHKFYLVEAERQRVLGERIQAMDLYDKAISLAKENEYFQEEALGNELAAKFYLDYGKEKFAQVYFKDSHYCYQRWGAMAKVKNLEAKYPQFVQPLTAVNTPFDPRSSLPNRSAGSLNAVLDKSTLMKAAFAISSEIELDKLLTTLIRILLENTGAQTSYLILESDGEWRVEAAGNSEEIKVCQSLPMENCLPASMINYVARTQETIVLNDASSADPFSADFYIQTVKPKSILCLPLLNGGQLIGIVYLENNLATGVFTPNRLEIVKLLSTQAAISLTNARLYTQVRLSESRLHKFLNAIPIGISVHDATGQVAYANQVAQQLLSFLDFPAVEFMYQAGTGEKYPLAQLPLVRSLAGEQAMADDLELHSPNGIISLEATSTPIFNDRGDVEYAIATFQDITQRKQAEEILENYNKTLENQVVQRTAELGQINLHLEAEIASRQQIELSLRKSEAKLTTILNNVGACIYIKDLHGTYIYVNPRTAQVFGVPVAEIIGKNDYQFFSEELAASIQKSDKQVIETGTVLQTHESGFIAHSGEFHHYFSARVPLKNPDGSIIGLCGISTDITSLKQAEAALRQSEARYLGIIEDQTELIVRYLPDGTLTFANEAYCRFFGVKREEIIGNNYTPIVFEEDREYVHREINYISRENPVVTIENRVIVGGEVRWMQWINRGIFDENGQIIEYQGVGRDISQRKEFEAALKANEYFLQKVANAVPQVLYILDLSQHTTIYLNRQCDAVFGYSPEEFYQASGEWFISRIHPDDRQLYNNINSRFLNLTDNEVLSTEYRFQHKNGEWHWLQAREVVFARDANGIPTQILGAVQDISNQKKAEVFLAEAKEAAVAANKAKSVFLANMSHELRTPLNVILGFSRLMSNDTTFTKEQQENLNIICRSGEHLLSLINQVLELSKIEAGRETFNETNFDLYYLLILLEDMFSLKAKDKGLQLKFERLANVPQYICTDEPKLRQVLINLLNNAIKFTEAGRVSLKVAMENNRLICEISDTGVGIAPEEFDKLFKPFMQTSSSQKVQEGTGLGLTISCQFVRLMGGEITVISNGQVFTPGERKLIVTSFDESQLGTTFRISIPVGICQENEIEKPQQARRVIGLAPNQPQYKILVVDDNDYNRKLLVKILNNLGLAVKEASNGAEAIAIWQSWEPQLIWMDMRMPVMNGYEATKQIKATTKGQATAVIAITASALEEEKAVVLSAGCDDFVRKPFQEQVIFDMMAKHLGISYIYQSSELDSDAENVVGEPLNLTSVLATMSRRWIVKLHEATLDADSELVAKLLLEIPDSYMQELQTLRDWVKKFEFEKILDLTEPLVEKR